MLLKGFINSQTHLFLREKMMHNRFDYQFDLVKPLTHFFNHHKI